MKLLTIVIVNCEESLALSPQSPLQPLRPPHIPSFGQQWFQVSLNHQVFFSDSLFRQRTGEIQRIRVLHPLKYPYTEDRRSQTLESIQVCLEATISRQELGNVVPNLPIFMIFWWYIGTSILLSDPKIQSYLGELNAFLISNVYIRQYFFTPSHLFPEIAFLAISAMRSTVSIVDLPFLNPYCWSNPEPEPIFSFMHFWKYLTKNV